jgi:hypothetical protein
MKRNSLSALFLILCALCIFRAYKTNPTATLPIKVTDWDSFGYYLYLPATFIYHDVKALAWYPNIQTQYQVTGDLYQASKHKNGNYVTKYLMGEAILCLPFFALGHGAAILTGYPPDGFSLPYQLAIVLAAFSYALLGFGFLRKVLLHFFEDKTTAFCLILVALATNFLEYAAVECGMTHVYLFALYAFMLYATLRWHEQPSIKSAFIIGIIFGLAVITRPTEAVMLFIPLLWNTQDAETKQRKWTLVRQYKMHFLWVILGSFLMVFPQLFYWKLVTGAWVYDVGSKFLMFNPYFRVLFGFTNGWFIYTPITIFMVLGIFWSKKQPFYKGILVYFILNTWLVIAWSDWHYGATYSCRALLQSCAVLALPLAVVLEKGLANRFRVVVILVGSFFIFLNLFQLKQYSDDIIHFREMNFSYYKAIFLNPNPTAIQMSRLDTDEFLNNENMLQYTTLYSSQDSIIQISATSKLLLFEQKTSLLPSFSNKNQEKWLKITAQVSSDWGAFGSHLVTELSDQGQLKTTRCRLQNARIKRYNDWNNIEYYFKIPVSTSPDALLSLRSETNETQKVLLKNVQIEILQFRNPF